MVLASYHFGVEQHWWTSVMGCNSDLIRVSSVDELKAMLLTKRLPDCDSAEWTFYGITMAGYNAFFSVNLGLICLFGFFKKNKEKFV